MKNRKAKSSFRGERRTRPRFRSPPARCNLGRILDLSANGLRIQINTHRKLSPGDTVSLAINGMEVLMRVAWAKKHFRKCTVGMVFEAPTPELRRLLTSIAVETVSVPRLADVKDMAA